MRPLLAIIINGTFFTVSYSTAGYFSFYIRFVYILELAPTKGYIFLHASYWVLYMLQLVPPYVDANTRNIDPIFYKIPIICGIVGIVVNYIFT